MRLTLGPGRTLRVRVVDGAGQPLAGASVGLSFSMPFDQPFPDQRFPVRNPEGRSSRKTDADGRLVQEHVPDQELVLGGGVPNNGGWQEVIVRPDDLEHVITITLPRGSRPRPLVVTGTVNDADKGEPLPRFLLGVGHLDRGPTGAEEPSWGTLGGDWLSFAGGTFLCLDRGNGSGRMGSRRRPRSGF
jgi:hypothetical protein